MRYRTQEPHAASLQFRDGHPHRNTDVLVALQTKLWELRHYLRFQFRDSPNLWAIDVRSHAGVTDLAQRQTLLMLFQNGFAALIAGHGC